MSIFENLKSDLKAARLENSDKANLLRVIIGDLSPKGNDKTIPSDDIVIVYLRKMRSNIAENCRLAGSSNCAITRVSKTAKFSKEFSLINEILLTYYTGLSTEATIEIVTNFISNTESPNIGKVMKYMKENHNNKYEPEVVKETCLSLL